MAEKECVNQEWCITPPGCQVSNSLTRNAFQNKYSERFFFFYKFYFPRCYCYFWLNTNSPRFKVVSTDIIKKEAESMHGFLGSKSRKMLLRSTIKEWSISWTIRTGKYLNKNQVKMHLIWANTMISLIGVKLRHHVRRPYRRVQLLPSWECSMGIGVDVMKSNLFQASCTMIND